MEKKEYQPLTIPRITWDPKSLSGTFGELVAQPLEPGFGMTFGNALRRVLLGGVEGSAVTSVIIKGVNNEFSSVPGVLEDTMQLILNIKQIIIRNKEGKPGKMYLKLKGEGVARVADIKADEHLQLINPENVIAHVAADGDLDIEFFVESGRGYRAAQWPSDKSLQDDNRIYLDAMFSPIKKVTFDVEKTRVGGEIDYDKLICRIYTDGSESPVDALHYSVSVLRTQLEHFLAKPEVPFNDISKLPQEAAEEEAVSLDKIGIKGIPVELLLKPIEELELSVRAHNCLVNAGVNRIVDLVNLSEDDILNIKNFGRKSLGEVKDSMKAFGLSFNMDIKESDIEKALEGQAINS
jgi:DNA-directed RNA polymerase subunit alpha